MFTHPPCQLKALREKMMAFDGIFDMYAVELRCLDKDRTARSSMYGEEMRRLGYIEGESIITKVALDELCKCCPIMTDFPAHRRIEHG